MKAPRLLLAALLLAVASSRAATGDLLARLSFDDAGNGGTNLLRATVGADAVVRATPATPVEGIGEIAAVADAALLDGLPAGDGAVAIPNGQYLAVPVPAALASAAGRPYTVVMRIRVPDTVGWRSLLNMPASNDTDALVYLQQSTRNIYLKQFDKSSGSGVAASHGNVPADQWTTIAFAFGEGATDVYLNGTNALHNEGGTLAGSYADCAAAGGYILVGADDSYDDDLFYLSELRVYEGAVAAAAVLPGSGTAADPWRIASVADWNAFAANVALGFGASDHYRLDADVGPVSVSAGATGHPFRGTFDGDGRALDVALSSASQCCAPFGSVIGAAIRNLRTTGTVAPAGSGTALYHASGLVGGASGVTIERCRSSVAITFPSSAGAVHSGGFIGHAGSAPFTMTDCVFDGSIGGSASLANIGGLVGWDDASTPAISNCLNAGTFSNPGVIARIARVAGRGTIEHCYSTVNATSAGDHNDDRGTYTTATGNELRDLFGTGWMTTDVAAAPVHVTPPHDGSAYAIATAADWDAFAASVRAGKRYLGQTVRLAADGVLATNAAGTGARPFGGTFDGEGRTLAVALAGTGYYVAPFSSVSNATIRGLAISGTVEGGMHCSGLVGYAAGGANEIADCTVAAAISTPESHCGGVVGHAGGYYGPSATALRGCVFAGSVPDAATVGTFYGWGDNLSEVTLLDSFDASSTAQPIGRGSFRSLTVSNAYYAASSKATGGSRSWPLGGKRAFSVTAGEGVAIDFGAPAATYAASGLAAYAPGLSRAGVFYAGSGETVALGLSASPPVGKALDAYAPSAGTLAAAGGAWTLAMPAADIVVGATWRAVLGGSGTAADPFRIASVADWNELADAAERGQDTAGLHFVLTADVGPVARMVGTEEHPFSGVFDGAGHALDLAIADTANRGTAPFRYIKDAILLGVKTTGTVSGTMHCSGLAGFADGTNLVLQCEVAAAVSCGGSPHTHCGGILGHGGSSATTLRNCLFSGSIAGATGATGVLYGWGDYGAYAIESCLAAGTYDGCAGVDLLRTYGGTGSVANCYRRTEGGTQGLDARDMADGDLVAALGPCWEVRGGKVVPAVLGPLDLALAAVDGVAVFYPLNADGSGAAQPVPAVRDLFGATVDPAFYAATVRDAAGDVAAGDLPLGDYVLAVRALDGNAGGYTGSNAVSFAVCPAGLSVDPDYGPGETGRYFATIPASGTNTVTLPDGFAAPIKVYDDGGKDGNYGDDWDGLLVLTAPSGRRFRISGTIATEADHFDWLTVYDGADDTAAKLVDESCSAFSGVPEAIPATVGGNRSMALRFHSDDLTNDSGLDLTAEPVRAVDLASLAGDITLADGDYVFGALSGRYKVSVADGATVTLRGATIAGADDPACPWAGITCLGDATIVLEGASAVTGFLGDYPGIYVPEGRTLSVRGYGSLSATTHGDGAPVVGAVALAAGGTDTTDGPTRVLAVMVVDLAQLRGDRVLVDGEVATGALGGAYKVSVADGATVTLLDATIDGASSYGSPWAGLTCLGNAAIVLKGANFLEGPYARYPGLFVPSGKTLAIRGDGSLEAAGDNAPGIGALADAGCGTIVIEGGTVRATGTGVAAGIGCGSGNSASCDGIVVRGGTVVARGGGDMSDDDGGAGIGGTRGVRFGSIVIDGGNVTAYGGYWADGIGCGDGDVTINGGTVTAYGGSHGSGIGGCGNVAINGGTVDADGGAECPGIGGGCDSVVIAGGTVTAVGGCDGAGIGAGTSCSCGPVTIGPDIVRVTATCDDASDCQPIGNGYGGTCSSVTVAPGLRDTTTGLTRVIEPVQPALPGSGTEADPYLIESADHWRALGELVLYGAETAGKRYLLASNIVAATSVGTEDHPFAGVFDGGGRTLTANLSGYESAPHLAPFRAISGATISNLVVAGTVHGGAYSAGLVGKVSGGTNLIENCLVSASIDAWDSPYGAGIVGHGGNAGATTIVGCVFTGTVGTSSSDSVASFWGWSDGPDASTGAPGADVTLVDCFQWSTLVLAAGRGGYASLRVENVYPGSISGVGPGLWPTDKRGKRAWSVTAGANVLIDFGEPVATYATSGLEAFGPGVRYGGVFYAGEGETVPLSLAPTASGNLVFSADAGVLAQDGEDWTLTMPAGNVVVSAAAPRYAVTIVTNALVRAEDHLLVDGVQADDFSAPEGARVTVLLGSTGPKWAVESASVVAEGGGTVQSTGQLGTFGRFAVSFTMPDGPVAVTPAVVPASYTALQLGENAVAASGIYAFVAPTNASYSFDFGNTEDWRAEAVFDEMGEPSPVTTSGTALLATLAAGPTYYIVISGPAGSGGATLTIAKAGDVVAYPVTVLVSGRGTVEANCSSAPEGCTVVFTAVPDPGWEPGGCFAFGWGGQPPEVQPTPDGTAWFVRMPAGPITVGAMFAKVLDLGENEAPFSAGVIAGTFVAPEDGLYRFHVSCERWLSDVDFTIHDAAGDWVDFGNSYPDGNGGYYLLVTLSAGERYNLQVFSPFDLSAEATVLVSRCTAHSVAVDDDVAHGRIVHSQTGLDAVTEGTWVPLSAESDDGYEFGGWNVVDATGASVPVTWDDDRCRWRFTMPGADVLVSATFGRERWVDIESTGQARCVGARVNDRQIYSQYGFEAATGADVLLAFAVCPGWELSSCRAVASDGSLVPCTVQVVDDGSQFAVIVRFRMPAARVFVTPVPARIDVPELVLGPNAIERDGVRDFVAPTSGVYSIALANGNYWRMVLVDDAGGELGEAADGESATATLAAGGVCHVWFLADAIGFGTMPTATVARVLDVETHPVSVAWEGGGTVVASASEAPEGAIVAFRTVPDPGWGLSNIFAEDEDGDYLSDGRSGAGGEWRVRMPDAGIRFEATFVPERELVLGENAVLFSDDMPRYVFVAPEDGWYRFRTAGAPVFYAAFADAEGRALGSQPDLDLNFDLDGAIELAAGSACRLIVERYPPEPIAGAIVVSRCAPGPIELDAGVSGGRIAAVDADGNPVAEAMAGTRVYLESEPATGRALGGWFVTDASGAPVDVYLDWEAGLWYFRMPAGGAFVSATFGGIRRVTAAGTERCWFERLEVNGRETEENFDYASAGADVFAEYWLAPGWRDSTFSVETADGTPVPFERSSYEDGDSVYAYIRFRMPDADVVVSATEARNECTALALGDNTVASGDGWTFLAQAGGAYSFASADPDGWYLDIYDDRGSGLGDTEEDPAVVANLETGELVHVCIRGAAGATTTLTISRTGDAPLYPVTVLPTPHGTVAGAVYESPAGRRVWFAATPDLGWRLADFRTTDTNGNELDLDGYVDGSYLTFRMPEQEVVLDVAFERSYVLLLGENPVLFTNDMHACSFYAPANGWYRFRSTTGAGGIEGAELDSSWDEYELDENGDFDGTAFLEGGQTYHLEVGYVGASAVEASIVVEMLPAYAISVDENVSHGRIAACDANGAPATAALEGSWIELLARPEEGYEFGGWQVFDADGEPVPVEWNGREDCWYFWMPGSDVSVSATFGYSHRIVAKGGLRTNVASLFVNGKHDAPWPYAEAAPGADVRVWYEAAPGWKVASFTLATATGASVPCAVETDEEEPGCFIARFRMPDAHVVVTPVEDRVDLPELDLGDNTIEAAGDWSFVAPADGEYSFSIPAESNWGLFLCDDMGVPLGMTGKDDVVAAPLAAGETCYASFRSGGGGPIVATVSKTGDATTYPVSLVSEHAAAEGLPSALPADRSVSFRLVPERGWAVEDVVAKQADGTTLGMLVGEEWVGFEMPASAVTIEVKFVPGLPWYLEFADDDVMDNYYRWARQYGDDPFGTNLVAFLLDADPAEPVAEGAAPLRVADFAVTNGTVLLELASDRARLSDLTPDGPGASGALRTVDCMLGNGYLVLRTTDRLGGEWTTWPLSILEARDDGCIVARPGTRFPGVPGLVGSGQVEFDSSILDLPSGFFRPALTTIDPAPAGNGGGGGGPIIH